LLGCASGAPERPDASADPEPPIIDAAAPEPDAAADPGSGGRPPPDAQTDSGPGSDADTLPPLDHDAGADDPASAMCRDGTARGDCGCPDEPGAEPQGTACDDGACALSSECDGEGRCGSAADCDKPHASCGAMRMHTGHYYYVCPSALSWADAREACRSKPRFDLVRIDDAAEQSFLETSVTSLTEDVWLNATDMATPDSWAWMDDGTVFWMGAAANRRYSNWADAEPDGDGDCARHTRAPESAWRDGPCAEPRFFVCEGAPP
jgi:hypothetical protein